MSVLVLLPRQVVLPKTSSFPASNLRWCHDARPRLINRSAPPSGSLGVCRAPSVLSHPIGRRDPISHHALRTANLRPADALRQEQCTIAGRASAQITADYGFRLGGQTSGERPKRWIAGGDWRVANITRSRSPKSGTLEALSSHRRAIWSYHDALLFTLNFPRWPPEQ